ncbi:hypothetical protein E0U70_20180 [Salmonella enterica subsp. enterica serovar Gloucester]|nr:hypothetical protein [Salmonella enterica subsp. enterica serovar Gloucester]
MSIKDYYEEYEVDEFKLYHNGDIFKCFYVSHLGSIFELSEHHYKKVNLTGGKICMLGFLSEQPFQVGDELTLSTDIDKTINLIVRDTTYRWINGMKVYYYMTQTH